jgi:hypothetical protein
MYGSQCSADARFMRGRTDVAAVDDGDEVAHTRLLWHVNVVDADPPRALPNAVRTEARPGHGLSEGSSVEGEWTTYPGR